SQGEAQIRALLEQERTLRQTLEAKLTDAATALQEAERRLESETAATAGRLGTLQKQYDQALVQAEAARVAVQHKLSGQPPDSSRRRARRTRDRDAFAQEVREPVRPLDPTRQERAADAAAATEHLLRRETELQTTIDHESSLRAALEQQLADAEAARDD